MAYGTGVRQSKDDTIMTTNAPDPLDELPDPVAAEAFRRLVRHLRHLHDEATVPERVDELAHMKHTHHLKALLLLVRRCVDILAHCENIILVLRSDERVIIDR